MEAREMFEKLEYINDKVSNNCLGYVKITENRRKYITFNDCGTCKFFTIIETDKNNPAIDLEELKAINKQVEELGWEE